MTASESAAGLTSDEARRRLTASGANAVLDVAQHPIIRALRKLWAPIPWMLEAAVLLQLVLGEYAEASAIAFLLVFNAGLGFFQEGRAQATPRSLEIRLALTASARRDGAWKSLSAAELVEGDVVKLSLGAVVPADVRLIEGSVLIDQSMLTGESVPIEAGPGFETYAGALVRRGEAIAEITATGARTKFGRSAELIRTAHIESTEQKAVFRVVRKPCPVQWRRDHPAGGLCGIFGDAAGGDRSTGPGGASRFDSSGAAVDVHPCGDGRGSGGGAARRPATRLSALDEAAGMDVLCADKTER